ncbi:MAG: flagellar basal body rod protein FlgB [Planctomycetota bacterium]|nr:flagellar basal body rod protein FlgB [Planctomycetota bacterium]
MMADLFSSGGMQALELTLQFAGQRQRLIQSNIANIDTPDYRPMDVSPAKFQKSLARAIAAREQLGGDQAGGPLLLNDSREIVQQADGSIRLNPQTASGNVLFHDRNNRDLERLMQGLAENTTTYRVAADLLRSRYDVLRTAISQRV